MNVVQIHGRIASTPTFSHSSHDVDYFAFQIATARTSGTVDTLNVVAKSHVVPILKEGDEVTIMGGLRSYNNEGHLRIVIFAYLVFHEEGPDTNSVEIEGYIRKAPILRKTPNNHTICDISVGVNRFNLVDRIPCIAWGRIAHLCAAKQQGDTIHLKGRIQSRSYLKEGQEYTTYEVSISETQS